jgi:hypothetical protein
MSDAVLTVLKFCLLALLYVFLLRVVWIVARELRGTPVPEPVPAPAAAPAPTVATAARTRRRQWRVVVVQPDAQRGQMYAVDGEATVGRGGGCTVPLTSDSFVSQVHARIYDRDGNLWIEDVGSTNGTYVNGDRIDAPRKLRRGDRVQLGETVLEVDR